MLEAYLLSAASPWVLIFASKTTKLQVVFNASQLTPSGESLNDTLLIDPNIHNSIVWVLMKWGTYRCVMAADI